MGKAHEQRLDQKPGCRKKPPRADETDSLDEQDLAGTGEGVYTTITSCDGATGESGFCSKPYCDHTQFYII